MSKLQDALDTDDRAVIENMVDNPASDPIIVKAARRVADLDYEAAAIPVAMVLADAVSAATGHAVAVDFIDDEMKAVAKRVVNAALHIDPPEETE